jgi:hypothetical protein
MVRGQPIFLHTLLRLVLKENGDGLPRLRGTKKEARFTRASFFAWPLSPFSRLQLSAAVGRPQRTVAEPNPRPAERGRNVAAPDVAGGGIPRESDSPGAADGQKEKPRPCREGHGLGAFLRWSDFSEPSHRCYYTTPGETSQALVKDQGLT